jgi:hypothetical protein
MDCISTLLELPSLNLSNLEVVVFLRPNIMKGQKDPDEEE